MTLSPFCLKLSHRLFSSRTLVVLSSVTLLLLVAGCSTGSVPQSAAPVAPPIIENEFIDALDGYAEIVEAEPTEVATEEDEAVDGEEEKAFVIVATQGARANMRSAPDLEAEIVGKGNPGTTFEVISQTEENDWYEVCCVSPLASPDGQPIEAWVSAQVVAPGDGSNFAGVAVIAEVDPLMPEDLQATWAVDWACGAEERCAVEACQATVTASADAGNQQFLQVAHEVEWDDACFATDSWIFEVDPITGRERTGDFAENFLYGYWLGAEPGEGNGVYKYDDELGVIVWCSEPRDVEIDEGDGWTTIYEGSTCHDVKTGTLVLLTYTKRWLYSGEYDGESYSRAYFGDSERLEQRLVDTNIELGFAEPVE